EEMQFFGAADLMDRDDVRVLHARRVLRLAPEAFDELARRPRAGARQLKRNVAIQAALERAVDDAHPAFADLFEQFVVAELPLRRIVEVELKRLCRDERPRP